MHLRGGLAGWPGGAVVVLPGDFEGEFTGDLSAVGAVVTAQSGMTSYPAMIARELGVPMVGEATLSLSGGEVVTVDGDRGVVYEAAVDER